MKELGVYQFRYSHPSPLSTRPSSIFKKLYCSKKKDHFFKCITFNPTRITKFQFCSCDDAVLKILYFIFFRGQKKKRVPFNYVELHRKKTTKNLASRSLGVLKWILRFNQIFIFLSPTFFIFTRSLSLSLKGKKIEWGKLFSSIVIVDVALKTSVQDMVYTNECDSRWSGYGKWENRKKWSTIVGGYSNWLGLISSSVCSRGVNVIYDRYIFVS